MNKGNEIPIVLVHYLDTIARGDCLFHSIGAVLEKCCKAMNTFLNMCNPNFIKDSSTNQRQTLLEVFDKSLLGLGFKSGLFDEQLNNKKKILVPTPCRHGLWESQVLMVQGLEKFNVCT